uniref:SH3 and PX domains 2Ab n=1 Tax=Electrophorus electricus TaxID=8005 RepID=A0A4W4H5L3_ELEEL
MREEQNITGARRAPVFIISVTYCDCTSQLLFRKYSQFFTLQMKLLDLFPVEGGQRDPKQRLIPFLPGKVHFGRSQIRDVANRRLKQLDNYCQALMRLPSHISQCEEVLEFFEPKPEDLSPLTDLVGRGWGGSWFTACLFPSSSGAEYGEAVGGDKYACVFVVAADYQQQENREVSLRAGERVEVIEKNDSGWWFVSTAEAQGWVPATYLISLREHHDDLRTPNADSKENQTSIIDYLTGHYVTVTAYSSSDKNDLAFEPGETVDVIQRSPGGWWFIRSGGKEGWAPAAYLRKVQDVVTPSDQAIAMETNRAPVFGQVEIIGNLMDISNLLNRKPANDTHILSNPHSSNNTKILSKTHSTNDIHTLSNINSTNDTLTHSGRNTDTLADMSPAEQPVSDPTYSQKHPPRRENSLGFQLPQPPEPPCVPAEYYTIAEFHSCLTDGISFSGGQRAEVIEKNSGGWWYVQIGNKQGWAPCSYIDKRKTPSLNRRTSTLTRPKVPPPAPPIKKQTSLPCIESEIMTHEEERVYEEPEYDVPAVGLEFEFLPGDVKASDLSSLQSAIYRIDQDLQRQGRKDQYLYKNDMVGVITQNLETKHLQTQSPGGVCQRPVWDPPEYDAPTFEPHSPIEPPPTLQLQLEGIDSTSHMSNESDCATSVDNCMITCSSSTELSISTEAMPPQLYRSTAKFQQEAAGELSLPAGVLVEVLEKQTSGWWFVRWGSLEGWVPTYYLQPIIHTHTAGTHIGDSDSEQGRWACGEKNELCGQKMSGSNSNLNLQDSTRPLSGLSGVPVGPQEGKDNTAIAKIEASVTKDKNSVAKHYASVTKNKASVTKDYASSPSKWDTPLGTTWKNESLGMVTSLCSQTTHRVTTGTGRSVPVSMVKPKPHLIHNNLHEEYVSIADYHGDAESMAFPAGTRLEVLERSSNGWWYCRTLDTMPNHRGWVPSNFLEKKK